MIIKQLLSRYYKQFKHQLTINIVQLKESNTTYSLLDREVYYDESKAQFYFKVVTETGFICIDMTIDEIFCKKHILDGLDRDSERYVYYVRGRLEERANIGNTSIYTFSELSPFDNSIFIVKSLINGSKQKWNVFDAYARGLYLNLDKPSIARFMERYFIAKIQHDSNIPEQNKLKLVK